MPLCAAAHPYSHHCEALLLRSSGLQKSRARCPCGPYLPASDAAPQQKHRALRAMGALNLLRDSHRAFAIHMKEPSVPRTGRSNCARSRLTKYQPGQPQRRRRSGASASHISGEVKLGSFSGISAEILEAQEGSMPGELAAHGPQVYMGGKSCAYTQASTWELIPDLCRSLLHAAISAACLYQKGKTVNDLQREENQSRA